MQQFAEEIAKNEIAHVTLLRGALGSAAVPIPLVNVGTSFSDLINAAVGSPVSPPFSPYANDLFFYLGAFSFEAGFPLCADWFSEWCMIAKFLLRSFFIID